MKGRSALEVRLALAVLVLAVVFVILIITIGILSAAIYTEERGQSGLCVSKECVKSAAMLMGGIDTSVSPCDDFYRYTCGRWAQYHQTADTDTDASWFTFRTTHLNRKITEVLEENVTSDDPKPLVYAKQLFRSCIDTDRLDELGLEPVVSVLNNVSLPANLPSSATVNGFSLGKSLALAQRTLSMDILVQLSLTLDPVTEMTIFSVGAGLGNSPLPEIVSRGEGHVAVSAREALSLRLAYMTGVLAQLEPHANLTSLATIALKILLADSQLRSDVHSTSDSERPERMTFQQLQDLMDSAAMNMSGDPLLRLDWNEYLSELVKGTNVTLSMNDTVIVENVAYFVALAQRLHRTRPETCQRYVWWKVLSAVVPHSTSDLRQLKEDLYEALFKRPMARRSIKCVKYVKSFLNMGISYKFAKMDNMERTSERVKNMLSDITESFNRLVDSLSWMDEKTKSSIRDKASAISSYIGYPKWLLEPGQLEDYYKHIEVIDGQFLRSMIRIKSAEVDKVLSTLGEKPDNSTSEGGWMSDPLEVNAFYGRSSNAVAIPAGILQTPFYFLGLEALNYGAIGTILGHELTHAFDIEGKDYDKNGRRNRWWSDDITKEYNRRADCFVRQYNKYKVGGKHTLNGTITLAENIADNGGVREALQAYRSYTERNGPEPLLPGLDNYTHEQLFFLAFSNVWCETNSEESLIASLMDVHSPNRFRVLGTLSNSPDFAAAWNCPPGSNMNPQDRCILW